MASLILYATKSGASEQCAFLLAEYIPGSTLCNLESEKPDIEKYDRIILGAGVRDGKLYKPVRDFIKKNKPALLDKQMGYYICNEKPKKTEEIITDNMQRMRISSKEFSWRESALFQNISNNPL